MKHSNISRGWFWIPTLYTAEGLPYVVLMTVSAVLFKRMGVSNAELAFYTSLFGLPAMIKPLWSPFVDMFHTRRAWIIAMQLLMGAALAAIAFVLPGHLWFRASVASFMIMAFFSATHDIAADGFYMLALSERAQSFFVGIRATVFRLAMLIGQGPLVMFAGFLEAYCGDIPHAWAIVFYILAAAMAMIALYHIFILPRPASDKPARISSPGLVWREFADTFVRFFTKPGILIAMLFMLLYKLPEAQIVKLIQPFLLDSSAAGGLALSTAQVGFVYGTVGVIGLLSGGIIGGILVSRNGLRRWMMPMAWSMSLSCLAFVWLAYGDGHSFLLINLCVCIEQFGYGFGTTAYMLYLINFSKGRHATANYAICTGIMSLGMMLPGMIAGWLQQTIGYGPFFIWTAACCVVTIIVARMALRHC